MLTELSIKNFAIIDNLKISLKPGLNILTGETGAGKSIIIDALNLALGERSSSELIRSGEKAASVESVFEISKTDSTDAAFSPDLISSDDDLSPRARFKASMIMDFPAPVSPVRIFNPGFKEILRLSMIAKFFIESSVSIIKIFLCSRNLQV